MVSPDVTPNRPRAVRGDDAAQMAAMLSAVRDRQLVILGVLDRTAAPEHPLVLTCRSAEYETAVTSSNAFLSRAAVLEIQPLGVAAIGRFLTATRPAGDNRWQPLLTRLRDHPDTPLARVLNSPLMVALARAVYSAPGAAPGELIAHEQSTDQGELERHLLDAFVPATYQQAPPDSTSIPALGRVAYPPLQARVWLTFLARHLARLDTGDLAWWRLADMMPRAALAVGTALPVGLLFGLASSVAVGSIFTPDHHPLANRGFVGLEYGFVFGLAVGVTALLSRAWGRFVLARFVERRIVMIPRLLSWRAPASTPR